LIRNIQQYRGEIQKLLPYKDKEKQRASAREWYKKYPEKKKEYDKKCWSWYKDFLKRECLNSYGGTYCHCPSGFCFETNIDFLTIDHIQGGGTKHRKSDKGPKGNIYQWLKARKYPFGYRVLCYNCNCAMGHNNGVCPHEKGIFIGE
jgi:hypothetical protein